MRAAAHVRLGPASRSGSDPRRDARVVDARCEPPYAIRRAGGRILVAASAAGPLGGDHLDLSIDVDPTTAAHVGTVGAAMVMPGASDTPSSSHTTVTVGETAQLEWWPEPTISVAGSDHTLATSVRLHDRAACTVVEEIALGRTGEASGHLRTSLRVERDGRPIVHHAEWFGPTRPGAGSVVSVGDARHVLAAVLVGPHPAHRGPETIVAGPSTAPGGTGGTFAARLVVDHEVSVVLVAAQDRPAALDAAEHLGLLHRSRRSPASEALRPRATVGVLV